MSFFQKRVTAEGDGFGQDLKDLRRVRGFSEADLFKLCGIHPSMIQLLEEERLCDLQDPRYAERMVRALAQALDVRPDFLLAKYRAALASQGISCETTAQLRPTARKRDFFVTRKVLIVAGVLAVAAIIGGYVTWEVGQISAAPSLSIASPVQGYTTDEPHVAVQGKTDPDAFVSVNGQQAVVQSDGSFNVSLELASGVTTVHVESRRRYGTPTIQERQILYQRPQSAMLME